MLGVILVHRTPCGRLQSSQTACSLRSACIQISIHAFVYETESRGGQECSWDSAVVTSNPSKSLCPLGEKGQAGIWRGLNQSPTIGVSAHERKETQRRVNKHKSKQLEEKTMQRNFAAEPARCFGKACRSAAQNSAEVVLRCKYVCDSSIMVFISVVSGPNTKLWQLGGESVEEHH